VYLHRHGLLPRAGARTPFTGAQGQHLNRPGRVDVELEHGGDGLDAVWIIGQAVSVFRTELHL